MDRGVHHNIRTLSELRHSPAIMLISRLSRSLAIQLSERDSNTGVSYGGGGDDVDEEDEVEDENGEDDTGSEAEDSAAGGGGGGRSR